jgi:hypothetical protein
MPMRIFGTSPTHHDVERQILEDDVVNLACGLASVSLARILRDPAALKKTPAFSPAGDSLGEARLVSAFASIAYRFNNVRSTSSWCIVVSSQADRRATTI